MCFWLVAAATVTLAARTFFITGNAVLMTRIAWNNATPNSTPIPVGLKNHVISRAITEIATNRIAELAAICIFRGWSLVTLATARRTIMALARPSAIPRPKKAPNFRLPLTAYPPPSAMAVTRSEIANKRKC